MPGKQFVASHQWLVATAGVRKCFIPRYPGPYTNTATKSIEVKMTQPSPVYCSLAGEILYSAGSLTAVPNCDDRGWHSVGTNRNACCRLRTGEGRGRPARKWLARQYPKTQTGTLVDSCKLGIESQVQDVTSFATSVGLPRWPLQPRLLNQTLPKFASNEGLRPIGEILYEAKSLALLELRAGFRFGFPEDISPLTRYLSFRGI